MMNNLKKGDQLVAVADGKGGFTLYPKKSKNKGGGGGGCGMILLVILALILMLLLVGTICLPLLLAIIALYQNNELSKKLRIYSIGIFIIISAILFLIFPHIESLKAFTEEILSNKKIVSFLLILNGIGVSSAILGLTKVTSNRFNTIFTIVAASLFTLYSFILNKDEILSFLKEPHQYFTSEQLIKACDCYNESLSATNIERMDLSPLAREKRDYCYNLFAKDYEFNKPHNFIDEKMKEACEINNPNKLNKVISDTTNISPSNSDDSLIMKKMVGEWKVKMVNSTTLSPKEKEKLKKIQLLITEQDAKIKYNNGAYSQGEKYIVSQGKYYENNIKIYDSIWFEKNSIFSIRMKIEGNENVELKFEKIITNE